MGRERPVTALGYYSAFSQSGPVDGLADHPSSPFPASCRRIPAPRRRGKAIGQILWSRVEHGPLGETS